MLSNGASRRRTFTHLSGLIAGMGVLTLLISSASAASTSAAPNVSGSNSGVESAGSAGVEQRVFNPTNAIRRRCPAANCDTANNWAGYTVPEKDAVPFTEVTGSWEQPTVHCTVAQADTAIWVGLDGAGDQVQTDAEDVEQTGTLAFCPNRGATPSYFAWWEFASTNGIQLFNYNDPTDNVLNDWVPANANQAGLRCPAPPAPALNCITVHPNDVFVSTVTFNGTWTFTVTDTTTKQQASVVNAPTPGDCTCARETAEWIVERTATGGMNRPLGQWKQGVIVYHDTADGMAINAFPGYHRLWMTNNAGTQLLATVTKLHNNGTSFIAHWNAAGQLGM